MKLIIHQKYTHKKTNEIYIIDSIKGDDIIIKASNGSNIISINQKEFEIQYKENFTFNEKIKIAKNGCNYIEVNFSEILEINLTMLSRDENIKYSSAFPVEIVELLSLAEKNNIQISFIHSFLELKTRGYIQNDEACKFEIYNLTVLNINQEISLEEYYQILKTMLIKLLKK